MFDALSLLCGHATSRTGMSLPRRVTERGKFNKVLVPVCKYLCIFTSLVSIATKVGTLVESRFVLPGRAQVIKWQNYESKTKKYLKIMHYSIIFNVMGGL